MILNSPGLKPTSAGNKYLRALVTMLQERKSSIRAYVRQLEESIYIIGI